MVNEVRKGELEGWSLPKLEAMCDAAGVDLSGSKEELIARLLESEGQASAEPTEPAEPSEPEPATEPETE